MITVFAVKASNRLALGLRGAAPVLFLVLTLFVIGPVTLYQGNQGEFVVSLPSLLAALALPALILIVILMAAGYLLPEKARQRYISFIFVLGLLLWIQGHLLVWNYGVLAGQDIDWSRDVWRGWVDGALWVGLLLLAVFLYKKIFKIAATVSLLILSFQLVLLIVTSIQKPDLWRAQGQAEGPGLPPSGMFEFSSRQNVIHILLDGFQSDLFQEIIKESPGRYDQALDGFTFFAETTAVYPSTYLSIPALLSGEVYRNEIPIPEFLDRVMRGPNIPNVLHDRGYQVDLALAEFYRRRIRHYSHFTIPIPYGVSVQELRRTNAALMMDLVLFRSAPHVLKSYIYNDQSWLLERWVAGPSRERSTVHFSHKAFLDDIRDHLVVNKTEPVYKYFQLQTPHPPIVVDGTCRYAARRPPSRENRKIQARCSLEQVILFLDKLRAESIYDNSLIVIQADHGAGQEIAVGRAESGPTEDRGPGDREGLSKIAGYALPLMLVKPLGSHGPLKVSRAPALITDTPATIGSLLGLDQKFSGQSVFDLDPAAPRKRNFFYYDWLNEKWREKYFHHLDEYAIIGDPSDPNAWQLASILHSPEATYRVREIDFGTEVSNPFKRFGWSANLKDPRQGYTFNWALGETASLFIALPKSGTVELAAVLKSLPFPEPQRITVKLDGREVGTWELSKPWQVETRSLLIGPDKQRPDVSRLEFFFSQHRVRAAGLSPFAVQFDTITLTERAD